MRRSRPLACSALTLALVVSACSVVPSDDGAAQITQPPTTDLSSDDIVLSSQYIETLGQCDQLLERIKDEALERVGPYGFNQGGPILLERTVAETAVGDAATPTASGSEGLAARDGATAQTTAAQGEVSDTNNQEEGVDEADLVKTDGRRIVAVFGQNLNVIDLSTPTPSLTHSIKLPDGAWGGELFLNGDRALLMATGWTERPFSNSRQSDFGWYPGSPVGRLIEVDLNTGELGRMLEFEGSYLSAREVNNTIRIVLSANNDRLAFVHPSNEGAVEGATKANQAIIEDSTIDQWIPTYQITENGVVVEDGPIVDCPRVHLPTDFSGFGSLVLLTASLDDGLKVNDSLSVFTNAQEIYASTNRLAVSTPRWPEPEFGPDGAMVAPAPDQDFSTLIHTFDITDPKRASYRASGPVRGHLLNRFSMSEHNGYLRVATTEGAPWGQDRQSESFVTVLSEDEGLLKVEGQVGDLGRGEQIFAVRFLGDMGYVVTFRQIDPLYTVDLSDPSNPVVKGELKIPGFSSYLHPIADGLLLGVGTDGDDQGATGGAVVSLFDVSDPANPVQRAKLSLDGTYQDGQGESYSPVSNDARAFTFWDGSAVVPINWWSFGPSTAGRAGNGTDAVVIAVDPTQARLSETGRVSHQAVEMCFDPADGKPIPADQKHTVEQVECWNEVAEIQRSVIVGEQLFTLSRAGAKVSDWSTLAPIDWIPFPSEEF